MGKGIKDIKSRDKVSKKENGRGFLPPKYEDNSTRRTLQGFQMES